VSEYQYYEFQAIDRPLSRQQMAEVRALSTRAQITSTRFTNEYHFGNFRGDPVDLVERYYDAHVYVANWGTRILMFGMPESAVDVKALRAYQVDGGFGVEVKRGRVIITFEREDEGGADWTEDDEGEGWMGALVGLRADLMNGDLRAAYLGWLHGLQVEGGVLNDEDPEEGEIAETDVLEPPIPPGLQTLSGPLEALARFLDLDQDLFTVAAEASPPLSQTDLTHDVVQGWIAGLPSSERDALLVRLIQGEPGLADGLRRRAREAASSGQDGAATPRRTVGDLWKSAENRTAERKRQEAERARRDRVRRMEEAARAREAHLTSLLGREDDLWRQADALIGMKRPADYDRAVDIVRDLRDLANREGTSDAFNGRLAVLRDYHRGKPSLIQRLDRARLT
jgi:hypothetical protein